MTDKPIPEITESAANDFRFRVYCLADDSAGPINPGDYLTASEVPGHAKKADQDAQSGKAIIGRAVSSLRTRRGFVLALMSF